METVQDKIKQDVEENPVVIFMKGTPDTPRCGFSAATVETIRALEVPFKAIDVLADPEVWRAVKEYSDWPTIPQVFIGGTFVGGCDIIREMAAKGELAPLVQKAMES
ncbi:MAG: Grx4 family monothiol glutaredoxin [Acidobacteriota bacterium]